MADNGSRCPFCLVVFGLTAAPLSLPHLQSSRTMKRAVAVVASAAAIGVAWWLLSRSRTSRRGPRTTTQGPGSSSDPFDAACARVGAAKHLPTEQVRISSCACVERNAACALGCTCGDSGCCVHCSLFALQLLVSLCAAAVQWEAVPPPPLLALVGTIRALALVGTIRVHPSCCGSTPCSSKPLLAPAQSPSPPFWT